MVAKSPAPEASAPVRESHGALGAFDIGCVVVGGIIGVGIFFTPSRVAACVDHSGQVVAAWTLGGALAILGALVFAWLSRRVPGHGGMYLFVRAGFGDLAAFVYGWANWLAIQAGALAVVALVMAEYLERATGWTPFRGGDGATGRIVVAVSAILVLTAINTLGIHVGRRTQNVLTAGKVAALLGLVAAAFFGPAATPVERESRPVVGWMAGLAAAMLPVLFSFGGWQQGSFVAGAARRPARDVPLGIVVGVAVVVVTYLGVNLALIQILGFQRAAEEPAIAGAAVRQVLAGHGGAELGARVMSAAVVVSALGVMNTICLAPPFVLHAMARHGLFFRRVGRLHPRHGTPTVGVVVQGTWGALLLLSAWWALGSQADEVLGRLLNGVVFIDWVFFALCGLGGWRLARSGGEPAGIRWMAAAFGVAAVVVAVGAVYTDPGASAVGSGVCLVGGLLGWRVIANRAVRAAE